MRSLSICIFVIVTKAKEHTNTLKSDMGKIFQFISDQIDSLVDIEQISAETVTYIKENNLDLKWISSPSYKIYQSKLKKMYADNYEQIHAVLLTAVAMIAKADYDSDFKERLVANFGDIIDQAKEK